MNTHTAHINATSLSQYIRLENCERFLRFRLRPDEERALLKKWHLTIQPLTPLLRESGLEFEQNVASQLAGQVASNPDGGPCHRFASGGRLDGGAAALRARTGHQQSPARLRTF